MENNKKYWFFGSKLNTVLLLVLIILMVIALKWMAKDEDKYFSFLEGNKEVQTEEQKETADNFYAQDSHQKTRIPLRYACVGEFCDGSGSGDKMEKTILQIPLVRQGGNVGCGSEIFYAPHTVTKTSAVLDATYKLLFDIKQLPEVEADGFHNTLGGYTDLFYDSVTLKNGTVKVYLVGSMSGPGHCAEPEIRAQINEAAFYFDSVKKIEVYLNGKLFNWCSMSDADSSESHCDTNPQYWVDIKK